MRSRSTSGTLVLVVVVLVVGSGCRCPWSGKEAGTPAAILQRTDARLADMSFAKPMSWPGGRLYDYMDGAAEAYFAHGFRVLGTAETKWRKTEAIVELYQVKSPENAKALFDEKNDGKGKQLPAGLASAAWAAKELEGIFHRGPYFCRVIIYGNNPEAHQLLDALAAALDQSIPQ